MPIERGPVLASYLMLLIGFLLAVVVASVIYTPPSPPTCAAACNASAVADLAGLILMVVGLGFLGATVFRTRAAPSPPAGTPPNPVYSFTGGPASPAPPPAPALPNSPSPSTPVRFCPACGAQLKTDFGFCPRCGQSIP